MKFRKNRIFQVTTNQIMKLFTLALLLCLSNSAFNQVYGEIFMDKRSVDKSIEFTVPYSKPGKLIFDIRVNVDGKVTSCILDEEKSTINAMGPMIKAKNKIMQQLIFSKGVGYPKWHKGYVQITTIQDVPKGENKFAPPN